MKYPHTSLSGYLSSRLNRSWSTFLNIITILLDKNINLKPHNHRNIIDINSHKYKELCERARLLQFLILYSELKDN